MYEIAIGPRRFKVTGQVLNQIRSKGIQVEFIIGEV